jgi:hypothetical protein
LKAEIEEDEEEHTREVSDVGTKKHLAGRDV